MTYPEVITCRLQGMHVAKDLVEVRSDEIVRLYASSSI
jgi:hypothetical protein